MAHENVDGWNSAVLLASDASYPAAFGAVVAPAASQAFECMVCDLGPAEVGDVRPQKDRNPGRGLTNKFVEGRVKPIPFSIEAAVKSRAAVDTVPRESVLYKAAGLLQTVNGGVSVAYTTPAAPLSDGSFLAFSAYRALGKPPYVYEAEQLRGAYVKTLEWSGGDKELSLKASGEGIGKYEQGYVASVTMLIGDTTLTVTGEDIFLIGAGYYQVESEVILVVPTATSYSDGIFNCTRAQVSTSAAAHTGKACVPYLPSLTYAGSPIPEGGTVTTVIGGQTIRTLSWTVALTTGMDGLPGESGSKYIQGVKAIRYDWKVSAKLVCKREDVAMLNKARARNSVAAAITQSTGAAGGVFAFSFPTCEVMPFKVPDTANDESIVDVALRIRDNAGNDAGSFLFT